MLKRTVVEVFNSKYYLLGKDREGIKYYLEKPKWDCDWYWGFRYIETFSNNRQPTRSRDIQTHQHANDFYPKWVLDNDSILVETPFTIRELWILAEYFEEFYVYKRIAEAYYTGGFGITGRIGNSLKNLDKWKETNEFIEKEIINPIMNIVTGKYEKMKKHFKSHKEFEEYINNYRNEYHLIENVFDYNNEIDTEFIKVKSISQNLWMEV